MTTSSLRNVGLTSTFTRRSWSGYPCPAMDPNLHCSCDTQFSNHVSKVGSCFLVLARTPSMTPFVEERYRRFRFGRQIRIPRHGLFKQLDLA